MIYAWFINKMKAEIQDIEAGLRVSQVVDYHRDHVALEDTIFAGIQHIIDEAESEAAVAQENAEDEILVWEEKSNATSAWHENLVAQARARYCLSCN